MADMAAMALSLLTSKGTTFTLRRTAVTTATGKPWMSASTSDTDTTVHGILDDYTAMQRDGQAVQATDRRYIIAASDLSSPPAPGDDFLDGSTVYEVVSVQTVRQAGTDVLYYLQVRR